MAAEHLSKSVMISMPIETSSEGVVLLEETLGILGCIEIMGDPNVDVSGFLSIAFVRQMANAAAGAARLVHEVQKILVEAQVVRHE